MSLLDVKNLTVKYPSRRGEFTAIEGVDLFVDKGEILGVVGESGAGKSTVGTAIMGLLQKPGYVANGEIHLQGEPLHVSNDKAMENIRGKRIGMIMQDPMTALNPLLTLEQQLVETIQRHLPMHKSQAEKRAVELLAEMEIPDPEQRVKFYPHQLSGGQRQRVVIALALCAEPELIIADEPTTALDVAVQTQILKLLRGLAVKRDVGVILITHDMGVIKDVTDRVVVMYKGKVVEIDKTEIILSRPKANYTKALIAAVPPGNRRIDRFVNVGYIEDATEQGQVPDWLMAGDEHTEKSTLSQSKIAKPETVLQVNNVDMDFLTRSSIVPAWREYFRALNDVSFDVKQGETVGVVGESGSGKSTVARVICGLYDATQGSVHYKGEQLTPKSRKGLGREVQMVFQDPYSSLNGRLTVHDILAEPMALHFPELSPSDLSQRVQDLLDLVGLPRESAKKYPHEFSGGQRQRISIARALGMKPRFLICDEPTSALDVSVQAQILNLLKDLQEQLGLTMIFISHDLPVIRQMCARIVVMQGGAVIESQASETLFRKPQADYTKELLKLMPGQNRISV